MCGHEVTLKLNRTKTPTLLTKFCCMATVKTHLKSSSYEDKHTHCGVVPWWKQSQQISIQRWRELVYGGWANWLMKTRHYSWLPKNDSKCQDTEGTKNNPFAISVDGQIFRTKQRKRIAWTKSNMRKWRHCVLDPRPFAWCKRKHRTLSDWLRILTCTP